MSVYITKRFASGGIRFSIVPRASLVEDESDRFSTGTSGEFLHLGGQKLYFEETGEGLPRRGRRRGFGRGPSGNRDYVTIGLFLLGALFIILGLVVVASKGAPGIIEIVIGLALMVTRPIMTAQRRREERMREQRAREARMAEEERRTQLIGSFAERLKNVRERHDPATLEEIRRNHPPAEIPYEAIAPLGRRAVLEVAFQEIGSGEVVKSEPIAQLIRDVSAAVGLNAEDDASVRAEIYEKLVWHVIADDRLSDRIAAKLDALRLALGLSPEEAAKEMRAIQEFTALQEARRGDLPVVEADIPLEHRDVCHHRTRGTLVTEEERKREWLPRSGGTEPARVSSAAELYANARGVILRGSSMIAVPYRETFDFDVDYDTDQISFRTAADEVKTYEIQVPDPLYTAGILDIARQREDARIALLRR